MINANFTNGGRSINVYGLTQWDKGQQLKITLPELPQEFEAHFANKGDTVALVVKGTADGGVGTATVPNICLTKPRDIFCYIYEINGEVGETIATAILNVRKREKPSDYVYEETEVLSYLALEKRIEELENNGGGGTGTSNYSNLSNKPKINGVELKGEKTLDDLGIQSKGDYVLKKDIPKKLPNPQKLTFNGAVTAEYDGSGAVTVTIPTAGDCTQTERIEKLATDTVVEIQPNKLYIFPEMESLTYTLATPEDTTVANEYHFVFKSGATATEVVHPESVNTGSFTVDMNKVYEVSIMEGLLTSQSWAVS